MLWIFHSNVLRHLDKHCPGGAKKNGYECVLNKKTLLTAQQTALACFVMYKCSRMRLAVVENNEQQLTEYTLF